MQFGPTTCSYGEVGPIMNRPDGNVALDKVAEPAWDDKTVAQSASSSASIHSSQQQAHHGRTQEKEQQVTDEDQVDSEQQGITNVGEKLEPSKSRPSINNAAAIPDGGLTAWLQVLGAFFLFFNTWYVSKPLSTVSNFYQ